MNVGDKIKSLRRDKGLTQKQLAELIHKSESTVKKYEANDISLTVDVFIDILNALDSKMLIESNEYCNNLLREYINSLNLDITEEMYIELETFIHHYIMVISNPEYRQDIGRVNRKTRK